MNFKISDKCDESGCYMFAYFSIMN